MTVINDMRIDLASWPGVVLQLTPEGEVILSNGKLEKLVDAAIVGQPLAEFLDDGPSAEKWSTVLGQTDAAVTTELVFRNHGLPGAPRAFSLLRGEGDLTLVEHPAHPRLAEMAAEVDTTNSDLATAQRA